MTQRKERLREKRKMFPHNITGPTQREEILREIKMKRFLNFIFEVCHNEVFFKLQDQLTFKTFQEFHSFLLISLLAKIVFRLSQKILSIPATSAPSEQVFSVASGIINKKRASIKSTNAELLMFLRGNKSFIEWS